MSYISFLHTILLSMPTLIFFITCTAFKRTVDRRSVTYKPYSD